MGELSGPLISGVVLRDVVLRDRDGVPLLRATQVGVTWDLLPLLRRRVVVNRLEVEDAELRVRTLNDGQSNVLILLRTTVEFSAPLQLYDGL